MSKNFPSSNSPLALIFIGLPLYRFPIKLKFLIFLSNPVLIKSSSILISFENFLILESFWLSDWRSLERLVASNFLPETTIFLSFEILKSLFEVFTVMSLKDSIIPFLSILRLFKSIKLSFSL